MKRRRLPVIHAVATAWLFATAVSSGAATPPIPDLAYGGHGDGIARITVAGVPADNGSARHAAVQANGGVVMIGTTSTTSGQAQVVLARFDAQGLPDTGFGPEHDGFYRTAFAGNGDDIAQTGDGKLVYAGHGSNVDVMLVGRLHADGTPDGDFFGTGQRLIAASALMSGAIQGDFTTVLSLPDGRTLALGWAAAPQYFSCAMRLLADGSDDTSFGTIGRSCVTPASSSGGGSLALGGRILADGRIRLAGYSQHSGGMGTDMSVAALRANDGALDTGFGPEHDGWAFVGFDEGGGNNDEAHAIAVDGAGRILLAGSVEGADANFDIGIARLLPDGRPDTSFGSQGRVQVALDLGRSNYDDAHSIATLPDGGILVGGVAYTNDAHLVGVAILFKSDGTLDPNFGTGGIFLQADPAAPPTAKVQSQQQILAGESLYMVGVALNASNHRDFAATRAVMPLFADGFENPDTARRVQP